MTFLDLKFDWHGQRHLMQFPYAEAWRSYLISFIKHGDPNVERRLEAIPWECASENMAIVDLRWDGFTWDIDDQMDEERCAFWQRAEYAPPRSVWI